MAASSAFTSDLAKSKPTKLYSCSRCFERKVRCDKQQPCTACKRSGHEDHCVFRIPVKPRRKRKPVREQLLLARLKEYEDLLKGNGITIAGLPTDLADLPADITDLALEEDDAVAEQDTSEYPEVHRGVASKSTKQVFPGRLYQAQGKTTFLENSLFSSLNAELDQSEDVIPGSEDDEPVGTTINDPFRIDLVLGYTPLIPLTKLLHPRPEHIFKLWSVFQERVNPLSKLVHGPTMQNSLLDAAFNLDRIDRHFETLMFGIYSTAMLSLSDEESEQLFGQERITLFAHYLHGLRQTLMMSRFMGTANLTVLQAFLLYIIATRMYYRPRTTWILSGIASRIAQGMGIHRDGSSLGLSIFESEIRRRIWWHISIVDGRSAVMTGSSKGWDSWPEAVKLPLNINDDQLFPGMTEPPQAQIGATEMTAILLRYELGAIRKNLPMAGAEQKVRTASPKMDVESGKQLVSEVQKRLEDEFVRYLDPAIPIQLHTLFGIRMAMSQMRLMSHHPQQMGGDKTDFSSLPLPERELIWDCAIKVLECDNLFYTSETLQQFVWHTRNFFQWHPFIVVLTDLRTRVEGPEAERGWTQVGNVFHNHPDFCDGTTRRPLYIAVGNLCLKAWSAREKPYTQRNQAPPETPDYIQHLKECRRKERRDHVKSEAHLVSVTTPGPVYAGQEPDSWVSKIDAVDTDYQNWSNGQDDTESTLLDTPMEDQGLVDWTQWDALLQDFELPK